MVLILSTAWINKRVPRLFYNDCKLDFDLFLEKDGSFAIHRSKIECKNALKIEMKYEIFEIKNEIYQWRELKE